MKQDTAQNICQIKKISNTTLTNPAVEIERI